MNTGNKIKEVRIKKNISQTQLAETLGTSQSAITAIENNKRIPKIETLERIAEALDVSVLALLPSSVSDGAIVPTPEERTLLETISSLNQEGKKKVCEYASDISKIPEYRN